MWGSELLGEDSGGGVRAGEGGDDRETYEIDRCGKRRREEETFTPVFETRMRS